MEAIFFNKIFSRQHIEIFSMETICMKSQILFSEKNNININNLLSTDYAQREVKVNGAILVQGYNRNGSVISKSSHWGEIFLLKVLIFFSSYCSIKWNSLSYFDTEL